MKPETFEHYLGEYLDGTLEGERLEEFERALEENPELAAEADRARRLDGALGNMETPKAPVTLRSSILEQARGEAERLSSAESAGVAKRPTVGQLLASFARRWELQTALAACLVGVVVVATVVRAPRDERRPMGSGMTSAKAPSKALGERLGQAVDMESMVYVETAEALEEAPAPTHGAAKPAGPVDSFALVSRAKFGVEESERPAFDAIVQVGAAPAADLPATTAGVGGIALSIDAAGESAETETRAVAMLEEEVVAPEAESAPFEDMDRIAAAGARRGGDSPAGLRANRKTEALPSPADDSAERFAVLEERGRGQDGLGRVGKGARAAGETVPALTASRLGQVTSKDRLVAGDVADERSRRFAKTDVAEISLDPITPTAPIIMYDLAEPDRMPTSREIVAAERADAVVATPQYQTLAPRPQASLARPQAAARRAAGKARPAAAPILSPQAGRVVPVKGAVPLRRKESLRTLALADAAPPAPRLRVAAPTPPPQRALRRALDDKAKQGKPAPSFALQVTLNPSPGSRPTQRPVPPGAARTPRSAFRAETKERAKAIRALSVADVEKALREAGVEVRRVPKKGGAVRLECKVRGRDRLWVLERLAALGIVHAPGGGASPSRGRAYFQSRRSQRGVMHIAGGSKASTGIQIRPSASPSSPSVLLFHVDVVTAKP